MLTTSTPSRLQHARFCSLKKPRSEPYTSGTRPKARLWRRSEGATWASSDGFPFSTSYCVIKPCALSATNTLLSIGVRSGPPSASKRDPLVLRFERLALAGSELVGVAETARARVVG